MRGGHVLTDVAPNGKCGNNVADFSFNQSSLARSQYVEPTRRHGQVAFLQVRAALQRGAAKQERAEMSGGSCKHLQLDTKCYTFLQLAIDELKTCLNQFIPHRFRQLQFGMVPWLESLAEQP
ncbi:hypothetical protein KCU62_g375, partial [Aureobasidium sp. EXF-3399]